MESVAARIAMVTDSPNPSLRSRTTVTTDEDSFVSAVSLPCSHFLSANIIAVAYRCPGRGASILTREFQTVLFPAASTSSSSRTHGVPGSGWRCTFSSVRQRVQRLRD